MPVKQHIPKALRYTVRDFDKEFPNDDACLDYMMERAGRARVTQCAKCGEERKHYRIKGRTAYSCDHCGNSDLPARGNHLGKDHYSAQDLVLRDFPDGFYSLRHLREADSARNRRYLQNRLAHVQADSLLLSERRSAIGGADGRGRRNLHRRRPQGRTGRPMRGDTKKTPVVAIVQRHGKVIAKAVPEVDS